MWRAREGTLEGGLGAAAEAGEMMADVAVVLLDREGQVLAGEQLSLRDQPVEAFPIVGQEDVPLDADPVEKASAGRIVTPTQLPGQGSPCHRIKGPPEPNFVFCRPRSATSRRSARCRSTARPRARACPRRPREPTCRPRRGSPRAAWRSSPD